MFLLQALNNKAVCLLYLCRLRDAIATQEQAVKLNKPPKPLPISVSCLCVYVLSGYFVKNYYLINSA